jgi:uncharacterized protein
MIIDVLRIPPEGVTLRGEEAPSILSLEPERDIRAESPIRYEVTARVVSNELLVQGRLSASLSFRCSRCGEAFRAAVEERAFEYATELPAGCESVDLTPETRESILLAFPTYPVCRADCKGLCPQCGANRNKAPCQCRPSTDDRWGGLDKLELKR